MDRFKLGLETPGTRLNQSIAASKTANFQPVTSSWGGPGSGLSGGKVQFSGGYANPNLISPDTKAQANDLMHQNLMSQLQHGSDIPTVTPRVSSTAGDVLGGTSLAASILGAFRKDPNDPNAPPVSTPYDERTDPNQFG